MTANNRMSINFDAALPSGIYDEETWLVEPPDEANSSTSSGHVVEWLQEGALNVDYETRSALARKLAKQAAKKKKRAEKVSETSDFDSKYTSNLCDIKEGAQEEFACNQSCSAEVGSSERLSSVLRTAPVQSSEEKLGDLLMACSIASETSSDDEFFDVPEYPSFNPSALTEQKAVEKVKPLSHDLAAVKEFPEEGRFSSRQESLDEVDFPITSPHLSGRSEVVDVTPVRQTNTARVPPTVVLGKNLRHSSPTTSTNFKRNSPQVLKSHSVASADLLDIQRKAIQQELALREECNLWKPSSQSDCTSPAVRLRTTSSTHPEIMKGSLSMSSSRSADFLDSPHPITVSTVVPSRSSRLPTPVRRAGPNSRTGMAGNRFSNMSTMRSYFGDAATTLPGRRSTDAQSECGRLSLQRRPWADGTF